MTTPTFSAPPAHATGNTPELYTGSNYDSVPAHRGRLFLCTSQFITRHPKFLHVIISNIVHMALM